MIDDHESNHKKKNPRDVIKNDKEILLNRKVATAPSMKHKKPDFLCFLTKTCSVIDIAVDFRINIKKKL